VILDIFDVSQVAQDATSKPKQHSKYLPVVFDAIRELMRPPEMPKRRTGFHS
jgi:hypothetical protein